MQTLDDFKRHLNSMKSSMEKRIHAIDKDITREVSADWEEQAVERENHEVLESLGTASNHQLNQIKRALQRIDAGDYFICEECGEPIPPVRLELLPFTTQCVNCAEEHEH